MTSPGKLYEHSGRLAHCHAVSEVLLCLSLQEHVEEMCKHVDTPLVFPLSNPTSQAEITAEQAYEWSKGKAIFASGMLYLTSALKHKSDGSSSACGMMECSSYLAMANEPHASLRVHE